MGKPKPTPPRETSAAQTGTSVSTAIANAFLGNIDENTPDGTKTFQQTGSYTFTDPYTNETYTVPRFTMNQTLSPQQQAIKEQQDRASLGLSTLGANLTDQLGGQLTNNFTLDNESTEARLFDLGSRRLDPMFARRDEDLRTRLANQGIKAGSQAYDREMGLLGEQRNDAYNQLLLTGRGQAAQEQLTEDNQRINQISALLSGGQVSQPNFMTSARMPTIQTTDNANIIANYDQQRMRRAAMMGQSVGGAISGLGGLFALSDERAKTDKQKIGTTKDGLGIFSYKYKGDPETRIGFMAQEVARKKPDAVAQGDDGLLRVDYARAVREHAKRAA